MHPLLQWLFKMASFCMDSSLHVSINILIDNSLLAACQTRLHSDTAAAVLLYFINYVKRFSFILFCKFRNKFVSLKTFIHVPAIKLIGDIITWKRTAPKTKPYRTPVSIWTVLCCCCVVYSQQLYTIISTHKWAVVTNKCVVLDLVLF